MYRKIKERLDSRNKKAEIINSSKAIILYLKLCGVFPYIITEGRLKISRNGLIISIIMLIILTAGLVYVFNTLSSSSTVEDLTTFEVVENSCISIFALVIFLIQYPRFKRTVFEALVIGNEILIIRDLTPKIIKLTIFEILVSFFIFGLNLFPVILTCIYMDLKFWLRPDDMMYICGYFNTNVFFLLECIFVNFTFYLRECFAVINNQFVLLIPEVSNVSNFKMLSAISINAAVSAERETTVKLR